MYDDFISEELVISLRNEIDRAVDEGLFKSSGLSNSAKVLTTTTTTTATSSSTTNNNNNT